MSKVDWDKRFIDLTIYKAKWSKDKSRGVCAIIVNDDNVEVSTGYNGFPRGCDDEKEERHERPLKYSWTAHAEENAIYNAARIGVSTADCTIYVNLFPCSRCTRGIINSGIKKVVTVSEPDYNDPTYGEDWKISKEMMHEADIDLVTIKRIFKFDVDTISPEDIDEYMKKVIDKMKNSPIENNTNIKYTLNFDSLDGDIIIPIGKELKKDGGRQDNIQGE